MSIRCATYHIQGCASKICLFVFKFLYYYKILLLLTNFYNKLPRNRKTLPTSWWNLILVAASQMCLRTTFIEWDL